MEYLKDKDFTARFRISLKEWETFKKKCKKLKISPSQKIREFIKTWGK